MDFVSQTSEVVLFNLFGKQNTLLKLWFNLECNSVVLRTVTLPVHAMKAYGRVEV
jgi:hypothetical protein